MNTPVRQDHVRPGASASAPPDNAQAGHDVCEGRCIAGLASGENERERSAAGIGCEVDLGRQPTAGPVNGVVGRFAYRGPFLRAPAASW